MAKMNEMVASTSTFSSRAVVQLDCLTVDQGRKGKSDFQMKKNAIFKRAREHNGQISREILASVYVPGFHGNLDFTDVYQTRGACDASRDHGYEYSRP